VTNWNFTDTREQSVLSLENAALTFTAGRLRPAADSNLALARATLTAIAARRTTFPEAVKNGAIGVTGDADKLFELLGLLDDFEPMFDVVGRRLQASATRVALIQERRRDA